MALRGGGRGGRGGRGVGGLLRHHGSKLAPSVVIVAGLVGQVFWTS